MPRTKFVCGNWKMHKTIGEAVALVAELKRALGDVAGKVQVAVAPPFTALKPVADALGHGSAIELAAQDVHWEPKGAFTGEVSAPMLADVCCTHAIVGHSERRQYFGETDETVRKKVGALVDAGVRPIVFVGENLAERWGSGVSSVRRAIRREEPDGPVGPAATAA